MFNPLGLHGIVHFVKKFEAVSTKLEKATGGKAKKSCCERGTDINTKIAGNG